jgi:hypothetical protein
MCHVALFVKKKEKKKKKERKENGLASGYEL